MNATNPQPRDLLLRLLHVVILFNLAFAARLYSTLSEEPMFFLARQSKVIDVVLLVAAVSLLLPALLAAVEYLAGRLGARVQRTYHLLVVFLLLWAIALPIAKQFAALGGPAVVGLAAVLGGLATAAYGRLRIVPLVVTILWPVLLVFPGLFLFTPPISKFLRREPPLLVPAIGNPVPVVMIVFDEFCGTSLIDEHRRIDPARYSHFAALAKQSMWFRNATTMSGATHTAVPAILTGQRPRTFDVEADIHEYPYNLFTLLGGRYAMNVAEPATFLCPASVSPAKDPPLSLLDRLRSLLLDAAVLEAFILVPPDWPLPLPDITGRWDNLLGQDEILDGHSQAMLRGREDFEQFIAAIRPSDRPALHFAHVLLPHTPWVYLPSGKQYDPLPLPPEQRKNMNISLAVIGLKRLEERWVDDPLAAAQAWQRYLLQLAFTDRMLGRLLDRLREVGLYDRSLIVVTADHGVSFRPGQPWRRINEANRTDTLPVPLLIKLPHQREGILSDRNVQSIDILPTIADVLKIDLPWTADGQSALDASLPAPAEKEVPPQEAGGGPLVFPGAFAEKYESLTRMLSLFGSGAGRPDGLFGIGPHSQLIGRSVQQAGLRETPDCRIELFEPERFVNVDLSACVLPCCLGGRVISRGKVQPPFDLAVAINGTIRAVTRTYEIEGLEDIWTALVPEEALRAGKNEVQVFVVRDATAAK